MRRRYRRKNIKKQKQIMLFSIIGIFCFFSVGYAAFSSNFLISGKGTIKNRPLIAAKMLVKKVVTIGDGLYVDPVEEKRYVYKGASPDNYIWLDLNLDKAKSNNEVFRIMAVEADETIKVVTQNTIGNVVWDPGYSTSISGVTSANSISGTRHTSNSSDYCYYGSSNTEYYGCNVWGSKTTMLDKNGNNITSMPKELGSSITYNLPNSEAYLNTYLNTTYLNSMESDFKIKIATHEFHVGNLAQESGQKLDEDVMQESTYKWKGKIGIINATDYVRASTNSSCISAYEYFNNANCHSNGNNHNYLFHSSYEWTMSPRFDPAAHYVWHVSVSGYISHYNEAYNARGIFPVFYLISDIVLSGAGTENDPYVIEN